MLGLTSRNERKVNKQVHKKLKVLTSHSTVEILKQAGIVRNNKLQ